MESRDIVEKLQINIQHIFREGNLLADVLENSAFTEGDNKSYRHYHQPPKQCKVWLNMEKMQVDYLHIRTRKFRESY